MTSIPLILTTEHPCSYLEDQKAQSLFIHPAYPLDTKTYGFLIAQGFRRSGNEVYRPHCRLCNDCIPARIAVSEFKHTRNQNRCFKKNAHTVVTVKPAQFEQAHYDLYVKYQQSRHSDGNMVNSTPKEYIGFLGCTWCDTRFVEFTIEGKLAGIAVIDVLDNAISAVYTFFEPAFSHYSPGVFAVLWQIEYAKSLGKELVYLGYWIKNCVKMSYKSNYQPLQLYQDDNWL
jgi:arginine-tRNA-protein transferase